MNSPPATVLIVTRRDDVSADRVEEAIVKRGGSPYRIDTADFPQKLHLGVELENSGWRGVLVSRSAGRISLDELLSVYVRRPQPFQFSSNTEGTKVVYTHLLTDDDLADLRGVRHTVHLFQEYVPKAFEVRLTVVGNEFFAAKISTRSATYTQVDWRRDYNSHAYEVIDTPAEIRAAVMAYLNGAGLAFGAFDFVVTPNDEWVALECNPEGQWGWIEDNTGLPITDAIARYLLERTE